MKLLRYELKKFFGVRYLWVTLLLTLAASAGFYYFLWIGPDGYNGGYPPREKFEAIADFLRRCEEEPEEIARLREEYDEYVREADRVSAEIRAGMTDEELVGFRVTEEMLAEHGVTYENKLGYTFGDGTPIPDSELFGDCDFQIRIWDSMLRHIDNIIDQTNGAMLRYESAGATALPVYSYERHFHEVYSAVRERLGSMEPGMGISSGWQDMFYFLELPVFMFAYLLLAASVIFLNERSVGLLPVIRTTRGGRIRTAAAKTGALLVVSIMTALMFTAVEVLTTELTVGLYIPDAPVQTASRWYCPYPLTVGGYFLCMTVGRCIAAAAFSCAVAVVSVLSFSYVTTYVSGALFIALNVAVSSIRTRGDGALFPNLIDLSNETFLAQYSETFVFGQYVSSLLFALVLAGVVIAASGGVLTVFGGQRSYIPSPRRLGVKIAEARARVAEAADRIRGKIRRGRPFHTSLFRWEVYRLFSPGIVFAVILLYGASIYAAASSYGEPISEFWLEYEDYLAENYMGPVDEARSEEIRAAQAEKSFLASPEAMVYMMNEYGSGNITWEEYEAFITSGEETRHEALMLETLVERVSYLDGLREETGAVGWAIPDAMLMRVLDRGVNYFLLTAVIAVFARTYAADYSKKSSEGEFASTLRTTVRGRRKLFRARFGASAVSALALAALFEFTDLFIGVAQTGHFWDVLGAPVSSLSLYMPLGGLTVGGFLLVEVLLRTLTYVMLAAICVSLSFAVKKVPPTLFAVAAVTLLPYVFVYMGQQVFRFVDVTPMLAGGGLLLRSAELGIFGGTYAFALIFAAGYALIALAAALLVRQRTGE